MSAVISSREFNQNVNRAKRAADASPVLITKRGTPEYVLLRHADYLHLTQHQPSVLELLACPESAEIDLEIPRFGESDAVAGESVFRPAPLD